MDSPRNLNKKFNGRTPLRPHQVKAVKAVINEFFSQPRTKYIAACGTGKTMVGLHVAEALKPWSVIVFLPSLALIRQTMIEWTREKMFNEEYRVMIVCSDKTVANNMDALSITQEDLGIPITTDPTEVNYFLSQPTTKTIVVFSTYQSAHVIYKGLPTGFQFDVGLLDEAHKTAGRTASNYGVVLKDEKIPIKKRLSLTATPKHYKVRVNPASDPNPVFSMDDEKLYGKTAIHLSFNQAVSENLVCDYRVIISAVTSAEVDKDLLRFESEWMVENREMNPIRTAHLLALKNAVATFGIKKIFTFHGSIDDAHRFIVDDNPYLKEYLPDFEYFHISGEMPSQKREAILEAFKNSPRAIISNARCLSEGVDVPACDMVAFFSPKRSTVDIVQAIGRASRKHDGKEYGYVFLPILVNQVCKETIDEACSRNRLDFAWEVLQALKEQDEVLQSKIESISLEAGQVGEGYIPPEIDKIKIIGTTKDLEKLSRGIRSLYVEIVGSSWHEWLGLLKRYYSEFGNICVPGDLNYKGKNLGNFVINLRQKFKYGLLLPEQAAQLNDLGMIWNVREAKFNKKYKLLLSYYQKHGHCNVNSDASKTGRKLAKIAKQIRSYHRDQTLSPEEYEKLEKIGFVLDLDQAVLHEKVALLSAYHKENGHCDIMAREIFRGKKIGIMIRGLRRAKMTGSLDPKFVNQLNALGMIWTKRGNDWANFEGNFILIKNFKKTYGHCRVPKEYTINGTNLGRLVGYYRKPESGNKLTEKQIHRLNALGFDWDPLTTDFNENFLLLKDFKKTHGHCRVPLNYEINGKQLGRWVQRLRIRKLKKTLAGEQLIKLNAIGFDWHPRENYFENKFALLKEYKKLHGDYRVPRKYEIAGVKLGEWVSRLRRPKRQQQLSDAQWSRLNSIGFWKIHRASGLMVSAK